MKRYLVFAYAAYYPGGGWCDFQKSFDTEGEAVTYANEITPNFNGGTEVVDLETETDIYVYPTETS